MKFVRWAAAAVTALMSLMNLGFALEATDGADAVIGGVLCAAGVVAVVGLLRRARWGRAAVLVVGALNLAGGVVALIGDQEGAIIGITVSALIVVLGFLVRDPDGARLRTSLG